MRKPVQKDDGLFIRTKDAHQLLGAKSSNSGLTVLGQRLDRAVGITATGQPNCSIIYQSLGGTVSPKLTDIP